ncbi:MAG: type II secretion system major pseudopilin GspG [Chthoniobacteraceae bacterium]|nr:type II secretion system major pseudopilin GspG [Chthoniobacteraceae bacterium]
MPFLRSSRPPSGFTFLKTVFTVCGVAILAGLAFNKVDGLRDFGKELHARSEMESLANALRDYRIQNGIYPTTAQGLRALVIRPLIAPFPAQWQNTLNAPAVPLDPWNNAYYYVCPGKLHPRGFDLFSCGPDGTPNTSDDIAF